MIRVTRDVAHQNVGGEEGILRVIAVAERAVLILFQIATIAKVPVVIHAEEVIVTKMIWLTQ